MTGGVPGDRDEAADGAACKPKPRKAVFSVRFTPCVTIYLFS
ncbi:hypothetical protein B4135_1572 [Caldibacillus debilis]|uniref:Uncharacterized protein n=1 Tax=Caldibacillus debilis TaxID=301148 RepID=A0A150MBV4_9BACI|nr:hypothetical protein B4135_1572 [Caldibacillus debilis]